MTLKSKRDIEKDDLEITLSIPVIPEDKQTTIDIAEYQNENIKNEYALVSRTLGKNMRDYFNLDILDDDDFTYKVQFPKNIIFLSTSFFLALFGKSVRRLGSIEKFKNKYNFDNNEHMMTNINDGITDALNIDERY